MRSTKKTPQVSFRTRCGLTMIEVIVCISILATLAAMLLPATRSARGTARRTQCQNNLRNVGLAVQAYSTAKRGAVPPLTGGFSIAGPSRPNTAPWSVHLQPYLESSPLYDSLRSAAPTEINQLAQLQIETYYRPDAKNSGKGGLSYVANAGMIANDDWSQADSVAHSRERYDFAFNGYGEGNLNAEDQLLAVASGVFWREPASNAGLFQSPRTLDEISRADGSSQTILLSENLNTRSFDPATHTGGWISDATGDIAFGITLAGHESGGQFRVADKETPGGVGVVGGPIETGLQLSEQPVSAECRINANRSNAKDGASPRPSSGHPGVVNMAFADGSCKVIFEGIDPTVYARLLTPAGSLHGQLPISSSDF